MFLHRPENTRLQPQNIPNIPLQYSQYLEQNRIQHQGNCFPQQQQSPVHHFPVPIQAPTQQLPRQVNAPPIRQAIQNYHDDDAQSAYSSTSLSSSQLSNSIYQESTIPDSASQEENDNDLKTILKEWLVLDSKIKETITVLRKLRKRKESLQEDIVKFMEENGLDELKTPNDDISLKEQKSNRYVTSRTLVNMLSQLAVEKNIPALRNFLSTTPLQFSRTKTKVMRDEHTKNDTSEI